MVSITRVQGYFVWSKRVIDGMMGTSPLYEPGFPAAILVRQLYSLFYKRFKHGNETYLTIPEHKSEDYQLKDYYWELANPESTKANKHTYDKATTGSK